MGYYTDTLQVDSLVGKNNMIYLQDVPMLFPEFVFRSARVQKLDAYERRKSGAMCLTGQNLAYKAPFHCFIILTASEEKNYKN